MAKHFADRLFEAVRAKDSRLCVGLDPRPDLLPPDLTGSLIERTEAFCTAICEATAPYAVAVKPQSAYFEALAPDGLACMWRIAACARELGLLVIIDAKRNDIGSTAEAYASACLGLHAACATSAPLADAVTVNGYLGFDGIEPFVRMAYEHGTGLFVLVKTSNPGSGQLQDLKLDSGLMVYQHMADLVAGWGQELIGESGYSAVGAVVGATFPGQLAELRQRVPTVPFLVPGYGFQGATAEDVVAAFNGSGLGALINSSRGIIFAYRKREGTFVEAAVEAAQEARDAINAACASRGEA